jgi:hypothetical protein
LFQRVWAYNGGWAHLLTSEKKSLRNIGKQKSRDAEGRMPKSKPAKKPAKKNTAAATKKPATKKSKPRSLRAGR